VPSIEVELPQAVSSAPRARHEAAAFLRARQADELADELAPDVELVVTELVTNAVLHGSEPIRLSIATDGHVRVEVFDGDPRADEVAMRPAEALMGGGRGLQLVSVLAAAWGATPHDDGKTVWAEFGPPD
jgi:anti-sigma regulatory factor (Ser/Thr protein kinase)